MALHARRARRGERAAASVARAGRAGGGRVRRGGPCPAGRCRAVDGRARRRRCRRRTSCGPGRTCTSTARCCRRAPRRPSDDMGAVLPLLAGALAENPDLAYSRLVSPAAPARGDGLPRVPRAGLRDRAARRARARPGGRSRRDCTVPGRRTAALPSRDAAVLPPLVLPHRRRRRLRVPRAAARPRPVDPRVGARDMDVLQPGLEPAADRRPGAAAACCGSAARCRCRPTISTRPAQDERDTLRAAGPSPTRTPSSRRSRGLVDLADDYAAQAAAAANRDSNLGVGGAVRPRPARDAAALRALARAHLAAARRTATARRSTRTTTGCTSSTSTRATVSAAGLGTLVDPGQPGALHGGGLGAGRRRARGEPTRCAPPSSCASWPSSGARASSTPLVAAAPGRALADRTPLPRRVRGRRRDRAPRASEASALPRLRRSPAQRGVRCAAPARWRARPVSPSRRAAGHLVDRVLARRGVRTAGGAPSGARRGRVRGRRRGCRTAGRVPAWLADLLARAPWLRFAPLALAVVAVVLGVLLGGLRRADRRRRRGGGARRACACSRRAGTRTILAADRVARGTADARGRRTACRRAPDFVIAAPGQRLDAAHRRGRQRRGDAVQGGAASTRARLQQDARAAAPPRGRSRRSTSRRSRRSSSAAIDPDVTRCRAASPQASRCRAALDERRRSTRSREVMAYPADRHADVRAARGHLRPSCSCRTST